MHASIDCRPGPTTGAPPPEGQASRVTRLGSAVAAGAIAALAGSAPAALRVAPLASAEANAVAVAFALGAAALVPMVVAVLVLRRARRGLASLAREAAGSRAGAHTQQLIAGFALWGFASLDVLAIFASTLRATTHHHALAGVTFSVLGLAVLIGLGLVCARVVALATSWRVAARVTVLGTSTAFVIAIFFWFALRAARVSPSPATDLLMDILAYAIAATLTSHPAFARWPVAALGPPLAVLIAAVSVAPLRAPSVEPAVAARAPLLAEPVHLVAELVNGR